MLLHDKHAITGLTKQRLGSRRRLFGSLNGALLTQVVFMSNGVMQSCATCGATS